MNLDQIGNISEAIAAVAVVISLVFLAVELRRNTKTIRATSANSSDSAFAALNRDLASNEQYAAVILKSLNPATKREDLSDSEWAQVLFFTRAALQTTQSQWFLKEEGLLSEKIWEARKRWARGYIEYPLVAEIWKDELKHDIYLPEFMEEIGNAPLVSGGMTIKNETN